MKTVTLAFTLALALPTVTSAEQAAGPCTAPEYHQFDFWLGEWTAWDKEGTQKLGTNRLHRIIDNCGMQENWTSASGQYRGTSYNYYVPSEKVWRQAWVDNQGGSLSLEGRFERGAMRLSGKRKNAEGKTVLDRITWTPLEDGRVRQHWQASEDKGRTWSEVFDGYYQRTDRD